MPIYEKSVRDLLKQYKSEKKISPGDIITRQEIIEWFNHNYPLIKRGTITAHLIRLSTNAPSRIHYYVDLNGADDVFYQIDSKHFRLYNKENDSVPIYKAEDIANDSINVSENVDDDEAIQEQREFAYERDLRNYLSKNLGDIEAGLRLYEEEGIKGIEFPVGGRFIDILAVDSQNNFVVIELKVSRGYDRVVGQILRYMAWIEKNLSEENQKVKGVIIASNISEDLSLAASKIPDVSLYEYDLEVNLRKK